MPSSRFDGPRETALVSLKDKPAGVISAPTLDRPVASLAECVQKAMGAFYTVQKGLMLNKKVPKAFSEQFKRGKQLFRTECESMRQVLQSSYRHAADYAVSSQRAPDDRSISAKRCFLSAKSVHRDVQEITKRFETTMEDFASQRSALAGYLSRDGSRPDPADFDDPIIALFNALEGVQSSLRDVQGFWEHHVSFLSLLVNRQTNFPAPGAEAKATFELWTTYQTALLQSSSSISESADAMSVDPVVTPLVRQQTRRYTHPITAPDQPQMPSSIHRSKEDAIPQVRKSTMRRLVELFKRHFGVGTLKP